MHCRINEEVTRLALNWFVKMDRFWGLDSHTVSPAEIQRMSNEAGEAERELKALLIFIMDSPGCRPCSRCSRIQGRLVLRAQSEFYGSQEYWCMACVKEYRKLNEAGVKDVRKR